MAPQFRRLSRGLILLAVIVFFHVSYVFYRRTSDAPEDTTSWFANNIFSPPIPSTDKIPLSKRAVTQFVDVLIGTGGEGHVFPGPSLPHGMAKVGIDTTGGLPPGYDIRGNVTGISHLHVSGTGGGKSYMTISVLPLASDFKRVPSYYNGQVWPSSRRVRERASVGYFGVTLLEFYADVEFTVSNRAAIHRYTWLKKGKGGVMFDIGHMPSDMTFGGSVEILEGSYPTGPYGTPGTRVVGEGKFRETWSMGTGAGDRGFYSVFFCADVDVTPSKVGTWRGTNIYADDRKVPQTWEKLGAFISFPVMRNQTTEVRVGLSFVSIEEACKNSKNEVDKKSLETIVEESVSAWEKALQAIQIKGATQDQEKIFYSSLYRTMLMPVNRTGDNPKWESDEPYWDDFYCIWDTFRSVHPLYTLIRPQIQSSIVRGLIDIQKHEGFLPDSRVGNWNGRTQAGSNADVILADAFVKGLPGIDWEAGWAALIADAEQTPEDFLDHGRGDIEYWWTIGYVPSYKFQALYYHRSAARTVEYAYNDFCIAQVAKGLGKHDEYKRFLNSSAKWQNLWNSNITSFGTKGFVMPRTEPSLGAQFVDDMWKDVTLCSPINWDPQVCHFWGDEFYESSSWAYSLYVPQDVATLARLTGGPNTFIQRLTTFFDKGLFDPGNEPSFLVPFMFNYVGRNDLTIETTRKLISKYYTSQTDGIPGNDDSGALGSWYVFTTLGFFPVAGQDLYLISSPHFEKSTIFLDPTDPTKTFTIVTHDLSSTAIYIQRAQLSELDWPYNWFRHTDIKNGTVLELWMGERPSEWGMDESYWPPSYSAPEFKITPMQLEDNSEKNKILKK